MMKKIFCLIVLTIPAIPILAEDPTALAVDKKVGYALLDSYTTFFHEMAVSGSGGYEKVSTAFRKFLTDANKAREQNQIDQVFYSRYKRVLTITGLTMIPLEEGIFADLLNQEFGRFVKDVLGEDFAGSPKGNAIGQLAYALSEEILNLHLYLDDIEAKDKLRKSFEGKFLDVTPKKDSVKK
jgi:hypothetical protein